MPRRRDHRPSMTTGIVLVTFLAATADVRPRHDDVHLGTDQLRSEAGQPLGSRRSTIVDDDVLSLHVSQIA